ESLPPLHRRRQRRAGAGERERLLGSLGCGERPESGPRSAGQDGGPDAHRGPGGAEGGGGGGGGGASPSSAAIRAVSLLGLNGLVINPAPRLSASPSIRSSPSAV